MARHSISLVDMTDLCTIEELVYRLLKELLDSEPGGVPLAHYRGGIRFRATRKSQSPQDNRTMNFTIDFPDFFIGALSGELNNPGLTHEREVPAGAAPSEFAEMIGYKLSLLLLVSPLNLKNCHQATVGGGTDGILTVIWFQLPPR